MKTPTPQLSDEEMNFPIDLGFDPTSPIGWIKISKSFLRFFPTFTIAPSVDMKTGEVIGFGLVKTESYLRGLQQFKFHRK